MDARRKVRILAAAALACLLITGLWQGYGDWLLAQARAHGR
jgi:hypothetical protein